MNKITDTGAVFNPETTAAETKSSAFYGERVPRDDLMDALATFNAAAARLDTMKKALFYGREYKGRLNISGESIPDCVFTPQTVFPGNETHGRDMIHCIIGKATEAGELCELLFASLLDHQPVDTVGYAEEIGDSRWYDRIGLPVVNLTGRSADQMNYLKLSAKAAAKKAGERDNALTARYASGFTESEAEVRNTSAERSGLEADFDKAREKLPHDANEGI